jgi:hypothetical protein
MYAHPTPWLDRLTQWCCVLLIGVLVLAEVGLMVIFASGQGAFLLLGLTLILFAPFLMMQLTLTPSVQVDAQGLTLHTRFFGQHRCLWQAVQAVQPHPLLPPPDAEGLRRLMVGRIKYRAAQGWLLVMPSLPFWFRFSGIFCGVGFVGVVALTNRTHTDYDRLVELLRQYTGIKE